MVGKELAMESCTNLSHRRLDDQFFWLLHLHAFMSSGQLYPRKQVINLTI
jgi:hypothetical protein